MRTLLTLCSAALLGLAGPAAGWSEPGDPAPVTLTGEIVDPGRYLRFSTANALPQLQEAVHRLEAAL